MNLVLVFVAILVFPLSSNGAIRCKTAEWELYGDICYKPIRYQNTNGVNYTDGQTLCNQEDSNAMLLMPQTDSQQQVVKQYENKVGWLWLGLTFVQTDGVGVWTWDDGTVMSYSSWHPGEPSDTNEKCVSLAYGGWHDNYCTELRGIVCQINAAVTDYTTDSLESLSSKHVTTESVTTSSQTLTQSTSSYSCSCDCPKQQTTNKPVTVQHFDIKDLKVDKTLLSSNVRRKTSASDSRKSSFYIGCLGIVIILCAVLFILVLDFLPRPTVSKRKMLTRIDSQ